jgi:hypothetical protein
LRIHYGVLNQEVFFPLGSYKINHLDPEKSKGNNRIFFGLEIELFSVARSSPDFDTEEVLNSTAYGDARLHIAIDYPDYGFMPEKIFQDIHLHNSQAVEFEKLIRQQVTDMILKAGFEHQSPNGVLQILNRYYSTDLLYRADLDTIIPEDYINGYGDLKSDYPPYVELMTSPRQLRPAILTTDGIQYPILNVPLLQEQKPGDVIPQTKADQLYSSIDNLRKDKGVIAKIIEMGRRRDNLMKSALDMRARMAKISYEISSNEYGTKAGCCLRIERNAGA